MSGRIGIRYLRWLSLYAFRLNAWLSAFRSPSGNAFIKAFYVHDKVLVFTLSPYSCRAFAIQEIVLLILFPLGATNVLI